MNNWQQMLKRMWEGDPHSLLEELENGVITVEISVENPQNLKIVAQMTYICHSLALGILFLCKVNLLQYSSRLKKLGKLSLVK